MTSNNKKQLFEKIYDDNCDSITRLCYMYLKDFELAKDATQETFLKAYKKLYSFKELSSINTWLTSIAINTCKNIIRNSKYKSDELQIEQCEFFLSSDLKDNDTKLSVSEAIKTLPIDYRTVILLKYYRDLHIKDISRILKIPQTTVNYRLLKAKSLLKEMLREDFFDE